MDMMDMMDMDNQTPKCNATSAETGKSSAQIDANRRCRCCQDMTPRSTESDESGEDDAKSEEDSSAPQAGITGIIM